MMDAPPLFAALAPLLLHNFLLPLFIFTHTSLLNLTYKSKIFRILRFPFATAILFFLKFILPSSLNPFHHHKEPPTDTQNQSHDYDFYIPFLKAALKYDNDCAAADSGFAGDSCIARALTQLLAIVNEIPVSSRKYEIVRSYAEKLMKENLEEGYEPLRKVNTTVLSAAFSRALRQLETAAAVKAPAPGDDGEGIDGRDAVNGGGGGYLGLNRVFKTVGLIGQVAWTRFVRSRSPLERLGGSAEKLSAELLWLAQKLADCGSIEEAVRQWASASKLVSVALSAQPRLQGSLVKLSAFLFKQATCMGGEDGEESNMEELRKAKMEMLMSWLPFLCRASLGTDTPILSFTEKAELERALGELIKSLKHEEEQEKVLSLWLHHFTHCPSSDWPNLHPYYAQWCTASRKLLILEGK